MIVNNLFRSEEVSGLVPETAVNSDGSKIYGECRIVSEHSLELFIDEKRILKLVCTPSNLVELVMGRMISEGYIKSIEDVEMIYICSSGKQARVFLKESAGKALKLAQAVEEVPTCCTDNRVFLRNVSVEDPQLHNGGQEEPDKQQIQKLQKSEWKSEWIFALANEFVSGSQIHKATQGTHSCYLSVNGKILFAGEDIGRHNAMDKAIGYAEMQGLKREDCILYTTGRVPTDMVRKVILSRIPVLVSKSVPTDAAVEMARTYNLTLICKAWPDRYEIFHEAYGSNSIHDHCGTGGLA